MAAWPTVDAPLMVTSAVRRWWAASGRPCSGGAQTRQQVLDALPDATALLDHRGVIRAVNRTWRMFSVDNGGAAASTDIGVNYLTVCDRAAAAGVSDAAAAAAELRAVLAGGAVERELAYGCSSFAAHRWYLLRMSRLGDPGREPGVLVAHLNITARRAAELDLELRASLDPLTGLANRALLHLRLTESLTPRLGRPGAPDVGVLFLDLDGFKPVNDQFGHAAGDEVLLEVAHRLRSAVRPQDTVARMGGDEFAVVAPRLTLAELEILARRVDDLLREPHQVHGQRLRVVVSVGAHLAAAGESAATSLAAADARMYAVKRGSADREAPQEG